MEREEFVDYYEFLMIAPSADREMVEWAVRLMLTRYGPKAPGGGDAEKYQLVKLAYRTLGDPGRRAVYDEQRAERVAAPAAPAEAVPEDEPESAALDAIRTSFEATAEDVRASQKLRTAIIGALYDIAAKRPRNPELGRAEIARAVGVRSDQLEFPLWFLREKGLIQVTASSGYNISVDGAEWAESGGLPHLCQAPAPQLVDRERRAL